MLRRKNFQVGVLRQQWSAVVTITRDVLPEDSFCSTTLMVRNRRL
jgi:hypothetical protein